MGNMSWRWCRPTGGWTWSACPIHISWICRPHSERIVIPFIPVHKIFFFGFTGMKGMKGMVCGIKRATGFKAGTRTKLVEM